MKCNSNFVDFLLKVTFNNKYYTGKYLLKRLVDWISMAHEGNTGKMYLKLNKLFFYCLQLVTHNNYPLSAFKNLKPYCCKICY